MKTIISLTVLFAICAHLSNFALADDILGAAERGELDSVRVFLERDPQILNITDPGGYTPLHKAAYNGHPEIVGRLLWSV